MLHRRYSFLFATLLLLLAAASASAIVQDFAFIQVTDVHTPSKTSPGVLARIPEFVSADRPGPKPSFVIATGDLTEFGGGHGWWEEYLSYLSGCTLPVYHQLGNHDNTWRAQVKALRDTGVAPCYSFDRFGCHFIGICTATIQDPRPSIGQEQIEFVRKDLEKVSPETPVFVFFHHPMGGSEFAGRYDNDRLLDLLRERNTVLMLSGHSHGFAPHPYGGIDQITGGSANGPVPGLTLVTVAGGKVRVTYRAGGNPESGLQILEKSLPLACPYPVVEITEPKARAESPSPLAVSATIRTQEDVQKATYTIDGVLNGELNLARSDGGWAGTAAVEMGDLVSGAHYLQVDFEAGGKHYTRSTEFVYQLPEGPAAWRAYLAASSKCTPTVHRGFIYVGANDGRLRALYTIDGKERWSVDTGAEIVAQPLVVDGRVIVANGLGLVIAYTTTGQKLWEFAAGDAVYSSPVIADGKIVFGCNNGKLYALDPVNGQQVWVNEDATYTIESKPFAYNGRVYYGAWDGYVRCVNAADGQLVWKRIGEGSRVQKAARYYSPADSGPVVADGKVFVADRNYMLTVFNADTGERIDTRKGISAAGISEDGRFVYLRRTDGNLEKIDSSSKSIWATPCKMGHIAAAPVEKDGTVYVVSGLGLVSAIAVDSGKIIWQYQASPQLYVMSSVACDGRRVYVTDFGGSLTAVTCQLPGR